ncbi:MAG: cytidine deaminase [Oscillospiraceae bacterium]|nr:cytidine deaminase [Oscillospiraceae bacterium]
MCKVTPEHLVNLAKEAMLRAYAPYSGFKVGAALLCADGTVYQGCNIENASYTPTVCAERTAFFKAISEGNREFAAIAICGGKDGVITGRFPPCGVCRQVMREFCRDDFPVYLVTPDGYEAVTLADLLPYSFSAEECM